MKKERFLSFINSQAYAELEKDTPGQIFGITFKTDGKSSSSTSSEPLSEKFTQRPKNEDTYYEEHDIKDTSDFKRNIIGPRVYFGLGVLLVFVAFFASLTSESAGDIFLEQEREKTFTEQRKRKESPFDEA